MEKKYVVKDFEHQIYYRGKDYGWGEEAYLADYFDTFEDAEQFIDQGRIGKFQIELVYIV